MKGVFKVSDTVRLGLHSLLVHKVQSFLTSLGIIIGVTAVITMLAFNEGMSYESQKTLRELGSDNIIIDSIKPAEDPKASKRTGGGALSYGLTLEDVIRLRDNMPGVVRCVTVHKTPKNARVGNRNIPVGVIGTEPNYRDMVATTISVGRFISAGDILLRKPHCVITEALARRLFMYDDPLGKTVRLGADPFIVVGILARLPAALAGEGSDPDSNVIIPIDTDRGRFGSYNIKSAQGSYMIEKVEVSQAIFQMTNEKSVIDGAPVARNLLQRYHPGSDYTIKVPLELIEQKRKQARLWNVMFVMIASVSLLVGGIGIANIMLASVTERTREIGIRRALGAKRRDVAAQFLIEAILLTFAGGIVGIGLGLIACWALQVIGFRTIIVGITLVLPLLMAVTVGLASGLYPALRASKLDPIIALRHE